MIQEKRAEGQSYRLMTYVVQQPIDDGVLLYNTLTCSLVLLTLLKPAAKAITNYTILTTTGCNARCFYCYEKGTKPVTMTAETADVALSGRWLNWYVCRRSS